MVIQKDRKVFIFLSKKWEDFFMRHSIREFAKINDPKKIICIQRPVTLIPGIILKPERLFGWLFGNKRSINESKNLIIYTPFMLFHDHLSSKSKIIFYLNAWVFKYQMRQAFGLNTENNNIFWIYDPYQDIYLKMFDPKYSIYECYDEYSADKGIPFVRSKNDIIRKEIEVMRDVNITIVVSEELRKGKSKYSENVFLCENAVSSESFLETFNNCMPLPEDIGGIKRPIIGYVGRVTDRIDFNMIKEISEKHKEWSFVFVGEIENIKFVEMCKGNNNIWFLGGKRYEDLPRYLKAFDVCMIPYNSQSNFNINCSPLKLYEYFTCGKPVVTTDMPAVRKYSELIYISNGIIEYENNLIRALNENDVLLNNRRMDCARENSWRNRAKKISILLEEKLLEF